MTLTQAANAWATIHAQQQPQQNEFCRLLSYWQAKVDAPYATATSRRTSKNKSTAKGQVGLKTRPVACSCDIEKVFIKHT